MYSHEISRSGLVGVLFLLYVFSPSEAFSESACISKPDFVRVKVEQYAVRIEFGWATKPTFPGKPGDTALEFKFKFWPKCYLKPAWDPTYLGKDFRPMFDKVSKYTNIPIEGNPGYFDVFNYDRPPTVEGTWNYVLDVCPMAAVVDLLGGLVLKDMKQEYHTLVAPDPEGQFALGILDAAKLQAVSSDMPYYWIEFPVIPASPKCTIAYGWVEVMAASRSCGFPSKEKTLISVTDCPYFIGGGEKYCGPRYQETWAARLCAPTGLTDMPVGEGSWHESCGIGAFDSYPCGEVLSHYFLESVAEDNMPCKVGCARKDTDSFFAVQKSESGYFVPMFGTLVGDCDDSSASVGNGHYNADLGACVCDPSGGCAIGEYCEYIPGYCAPCGSMETNCADAYDNDCDGCTDAKDKDCGGCAGKECGLNACGQSCGTCSGACVTVGIDWVKLTPGECQDGSGKFCPYPGPLETKFIGQCMPGWQTCVEGQWDTGCPGTVLPSAEICDGLDNDCDNVTDDDATNCVTLWEDKVGHEVRSKETTGEVHKRGASFPA